MQIHGHHTGEKGQRGEKRVGGSDISVARETERGERKRERERERDRQTDATSWVTRLYGRTDCGLSNSEVTMVTQP